MHDEAEIKDRVSRFIESFSQYWSSLTREVCKFEESDVEHNTLTNNPLTCYEPLRFLQVVRGSNYH